MYAEVATILPYWRLGKVLTGIEKISGGLLHTLYRVETESGCYAVKCVEMPLFNFSQQLELAEQVAAYLVTQNFPAISAMMTVEGKKVLQRGKKLWIVYPWVTGKIIRAAETILPQARQIGHLLATLHQIPFPKALRHRLQPTLLTQWQWSRLIEKSEQAGCDYVAPLIRQLPDIQRDNQEAQAVWPLLLKTQVISHRDLDPKNVLWQTTSSPLIIDWEYAGWIHPGMDLLTVGLNWSGIPEGRFIPEGLQAVLVGYQVMLPRPVMDNNVFSGYIGYCLEWLGFNLERALRAKTAEIARQEVRKSLRALQVIGDNREKILGIL